MVRLVAFDMDGTLVDVDSSWGFVHRHYGEENSEALKAFLEDRIDDEEFIRRDIRLWWKHSPQLNADELEEILNGVPLMSGAAELVAGLKARGVWTAIVSGGIDLLARRIGRELGIDYVLANGCRVDSAGRLTGEGVIRVPVKRKEEALARVQQQLSVTPAETAAVGNSDIDVGMFRRSATGVAFRPADDHVRRSATFVVDGPSMLPILGHLLGPKPAEPTRS
jgi:phosphoserine phosphatase